MYKRQSLNSRHVQREVNLADDLRKPIYPVKLIDIEIYGGLSFYLSASQEVRLFEKTGDPVEKLITSIKAVSGSLAQGQPEVESESAVPVDQATPGAKQAHEIPVAADKPDRPVTRDSQEYGKDNNQSELIEPNKKLLWIASVSVLSLAAVFYIWNKGGLDSEVTSSGSPEADKPEVVGDVEPNSSPSPVEPDRTNSAETTEPRNEVVTPVCSNETGTDPAMVVLPPGSLLWALMRQMPLVTRARYIPSQLHTRLSYLVVKSVWPNLPPLQMILATVPALKRAVAVGSTIPLQMQFSVKKRVRAGAPPVLSSKLIIRLFASPGMMPLAT